MRRFATPVIAAALVAVWVPASSGAAVASQRPSDSRAAESSAVQYTGLSSSFLSVKASNGVRLKLGVSAFESTQGTASTSVTLTNGVDDVSGETHTWSFTIPRSDFKFSSKTGNGSLKTKRELKSFGSLALAFVKKSQTKAPCTDGTGTKTTVTGTLSGTAFFNTKTGSKGWGQVGSKHQKLTFKAPNDVTLLSPGCPLGTGGQSACVKGLEWNATYNTATQVSVFGQVTKDGKKTTSTATISRSISLPSPKGAQREDILVAKEPAPKISSGNLSITTKGHAVTGSARIFDTTKSPSSYSCTAGDTTKTEHTVDYAGRWSSSGYAAHFQATGKAAAAANGKTVFTTESYS